MKIKCEIYKRIVGYYRTTSSANAGKQQEMRERKEYDTKQIITTHKL